MTKPRAITADEARDLFLDHVRYIADYWAKAGPEDNGVQERCEGVAFNILNLIDGGTGVLPAMDLVLRPHPADYRYNRDNLENWFKNGQVINKFDALHELFYQEKK